MLLATLVASISFAPQSKSVALVALGCPKNTVDAEVMLGDLQRSGLRVVKEPKQADIVIVNTCAFVEDAKRESIAAVIEAAGAPGGEKRAKVSGRVRSNPAANTGSGTHDRSAASDEPAPPLAAAAPSPPAAGRFAAMKR